MSETASGGKVWTPDAADPTIAGLNAALAQLAKKQAEEERKDRRVLRGMTTIGLFAQLVITFLLFAVPLSSAVDDSLTVRSTLFGWDPVAVRVAVILPLAIVAFMLWLIPALYYLFVSRRIAQGLLNMLVSVLVMATLIFSFLSIVAASQESQAWMDKQLSLPEGTTLRQGDSMFNLPNFVSWQDGEQVTLTDPDNGTEYPVIVHREGDTITGLELVSK